MVLSAETSATVYWSAEDFSLLFWSPPARLLRLLVVKIAAMAENRPVVISEQTLQSLEKLIAITESLTDNLAQVNRSFER